jgi:hypothetical protein
MPSKLVKWVEVMPSAAASVFILAMNAFRPGPYVVASR